MPGKPSTSVRRAAARSSNPAPRAAACASKAQLRFRVRVTRDEVIAIGPGKVALLEAIVETGSISAAAKSLDMSYRRAWLLVDELNTALQAPAVVSMKGGQNGGGCELTEVGRTVVRLYRQIEQTAATACRSDIRRLLGLLAR